MSDKPKTYVSSSGRVSGTQGSIPITHTANNLFNNIYNALGLYFVSLLSLDPYAAAQNSRFNTSGPRDITGSSNGAPRPGGTTSGGLFGGGRLGGNPPGNGRGGGRRLGEVNDVRGPECGSCG